MGMCSAFTIVLSSNPPQPRVKVRRNMLRWDDEAWENKVNKPFED